MEDLAVDSGFGSCGGRRRREAQRQGRGAPRALILKQIGLRLTTLWEASAIYPSLKTAEERADTPSVIVLFSPYPGI